MSIESRFGYVTEEQLRRYREQKELEKKESPPFNWPPIEKPNPVVIRRRRKRLLVNAMKAHIDIGHAVGLTDAAEQVRSTVGLNPDEAALVDEAKIEVQQLLPRISRQTLVRLDASQPEEEGTYSLRAARSILKTAGFSDADLTEENVKQILDYRRLLLTLKQ